MKKVFAILLIVFYASVSLVNGISFHYCHGNLVDFSFNQPADSCCDDLSRSPCCTDLLIDVEVSEDQQTSSHLSVNNNFSQQAVECILSDTVAAINSSFGTKIFTSPPGGVIKLFVFHQSFLHYG
jgi:hypothetical protein